MIDIFVQVVTFSEKQIIVTISVHNFHSCVYKQRLIPELSTYIKSCAFGNKHVHFIPPVYTPNFYAAYLFYIYLNCHFRNALDIHSLCKLGLVFIQRIFKLK